jgi:PAS domain S-box-containing protein
MNGVRAPALSAAWRQWSVWLHRTWPRRASSWTADRVPASLKFTVPLILLAFTGILSAVNLLYHVPQAEHEAEEESRKRLAQEMSRLQSTLEYLLLKGDVEAAQHEIAVLAHNHDVVLAALTDDRNVVLAATRRAWLDRPIADVSPQFNLDDAMRAIRERRAGIAISSNGKELLAHAGVLMGRERDELRPSRTGGLFLAYDLQRYQAEARAQVVQQSLYWAGWVSALAFAMWLVFHVLLTRRTARLVRAAEELAAGNLAARASLRGKDELGRLSRAFDAMAAEVASTQTRLRTDIAHRARVQRELEISEASYRAIFDASEDAIFVHDVGSGVIVDVNLKACAAFGYTRDEFRALDVGVLGTGQRPYARQDARDIIARAYAGDALRIEWRGRSKDGVLRWYEVFVKRVRIGGHDRVLALARDISARKDAEEALRASEEQYHAMFNASIDGLALWNAAGEIVDVNPALWRMYGHSDADFRAMRPGAFAGPAFHRDLLAVVAKGESRHVEVTEAREDGTPIRLEVHAVPMQYQGKPHVLTIARDITEKKRSEEELARQRESVYQREKLAALGSLLAGVAHELNNPLSVVVARAVLLEERGDAATQTAAVKIRSAAERCARIVRTFLAMARQQRPARGPVAINEVVTAALDIAAYAIRTTGIELVLDLAPDLPLVQADDDQLHQVLLNLVINAQQALSERPAPRRITITSRFDAPADVVRITVADNGPGIPPHLRARVFEPYFTTKPIGMGTGVGLAVSLGIVEAHGGTLVVESPPDRGASFVITLPAGASVGKALRKEPLAPVSAPAHAVLVVDDEPDIRDSLADILGGAGHRVPPACSGREALERLRSARFDVVLTDIRMPDLDGRALYAEIARRWPAQAPRVVFVTGDTLASELRDFARESGRRVIEKPFLPSEVRRVVAEVASEYRRAAPR